MKVYMVYVKKDFVCGAFIFNEGNKSDDKNITGELILDYFPSNTKEEAIEKASKKNNICKENLGAALIYKEENSNEKNSK